jgi:hypothetical protein
MKEEYYYWIAKDGSYQEINNFLNSNYTDIVVESWNNLSEVYLFLIIRETGAKMFGYIGNTIDAKHFVTTNDKYIYKGEISIKTIRREKLKKLTYGR